MKETKLLEYLVNKAKREGKDIESPEFKDKITKAKEYISKRQDYLNQQENIKKTAEVLATEIAKIKIESPTVNIPEIKIPEIKIPDITGLEDLKKELQKDLTVKGIEDIEQDLLGILSVTEKIMQSFDKPIPVVLVSPSGKEYEAKGEGGGGANTSALAKEKTLLLTNTELSNIKDAVIGFNIPEYNYISLSYTGDDLTGVVYKTGGSGGTTVATLTLAYLGGVLQTITKT